MSTPEPEGESEPTFLSHLIELRERLLKAVATILLIFAALMPFANKIYSWLAKPLLSRLPAGGQMIAIDVASPFFTPVKLAFFVAVFAAMPVLLYQAWAFVSPGLYKHEKRLAMPILVSSVALFYGGCAFAYFLVLPMVFGFLASVTPEGVAMMTDIGHYLDFVLVMFLAFGMCFEVPVATLIIVLLGWVTTEQLSTSRPYVIVGCVVVAALLTPPDALSMLMLAVPMCLLYEVGIIAARLLARRAENSSRVAD
ncbi:twin-arginine translocase subunit TatC [Pseudolysobacter antarcticus]|uniref:Sec-independent protein translocase protein TatC n=1 Tax=Pseudolysobacter antarcticus TaxID=2511995 RepID=A0A411HEN0_9GAMM|nr:twin-arginine translocase subunit TatC [Pseudolysobacter antarcticus]QBB68950.1 twin-arginine translocase subunit TatC [Pseudolysobacter antarcticus]